jgi:hypothetical protein
MEEKPMYLLLKEKSSKEVDMASKTPDKAFKEAGKSSKKTKKAFKKAEVSSKKGLQGSKRHLRRGGDGKNPLLLVDRKARRGWNQEREERVLPKGKFGLSISLIEIWENCAVYYRLIFRLSL